MSRYIPSGAEQAAIDLLTLAGYAVVRRRTYDGLQERVRRAEQTAYWEAQRRDDNTRWAHEALDEQRRLADRLTFVYGIAQAHGATTEELGGCADRTKCTTR